jgi:hypothetical protein
MQNRLIVAADRVFARIWGRFNGSRIEEKVCGWWGVITLVVLIIAWFPTETAIIIAWAGKQVGIETSVFTTTSSIRLLQLIAAAEFITRIVVGTAIGLEVAAREAYAAKILDRIGGFVEKLGPIYRIIGTFVAGSLGLSPAAIAYISIFAFEVVYFSGIVILLFQSDLQRGHLFFQSYVSNIVS